MEFQLSYFKSWKMMLWKCYTQYANKFGKCSSGHRMGKGQFSFQSIRKTMPKNVQSLVRELRSLMLCGVTKIKKKKSSESWENTIITEYVTPSPYPSNTVFLTISFALKIISILCDGDMLDQVLERLKALTSSIKHSRLTLSHSVMWNLSSRPDLSPELHTRVLFQFTNETLLCNQSPQSLELKTTNICYLTYFPRVRNLGLS